MKILMIGNNLGNQSGVQRYILNLLLNLDTKKYQIDLMAGSCPPGQQDTAPALLNAGVRLVDSTDNDKKRLLTIGGYLKHHRNEYDIIHFHTTSKVNALTCVLIKLYNPRSRLIVHSHIVYPPLTLVWRIAHVVYRATADYFLGCGVAAGRFVFGDNIDKKGNFAVACNAVDENRFYPNPAARSAIRRRYDIADTDKLCGFVGRYNHQKNLLFLLDIFAAMYAADKSWRLLLVGGGEDKPAVDAKIEQLGVAAAVRQAGVQDNVPDYMNAFDLFLLPSNFEGSPITLVEAQGCGVPCLASTNVPDDGSVTELVHFMPLAAPAAQWAQAAQAAVQSGAHKSYWPVLQAHGYELKAAAKKMEELYDSLAPQRS